MSMGVSDAGAQVVHGEVTAEVARLTADGVDVEIHEALGLRVWSLGIISEPVEMVAYGAAGDELSFAIAAPGPNVSTAPPPLSTPLTITADPDPSPATTRG